MANAPTARHDPDNSRYVVEIDGDLVGFTEYHQRGTDHYFFYHTSIDDRHGGQGLGSILARFALDDVRDRGGQVVPLCPFIAGFIERHPEYQGVVDTVIVDRVAKAKG